MITILTPSDLATRIENRARTSDGAKIEMMKLPPLIEGTPSQFIMTNFSTIVSPSIGRFFSGSLSLNFTI